MSFYFNFYIFFYNQDTASQFGRIRVNKTKWSISTRKISPRPSATTGLKCWTGFRSFRIKKVAISKAILHILDAENANRILNITALCSSWLFLLLGHGNGCQGAIDPLDGNLEGRQIPKLLFVETAFFSKLPEALRLLEAWLTDAANWVLESWHYVSVNCREKWMFGHWC